MATRTASNNRSRWIKRGVIAIAVVAAIAVLVWFLQSRGTRAEVAQVEVGPIKQTLVFSARVSSVARIEIAGTITGRIEKIAVREGDRVKAGQLLIQLEDDEIGAQLAQSEATRATAQARLRAQAEVAAPVSSQATQQALANLEFAKRELERSRSLFDQGFVGQARLQDAQRAVAVAQAAYAQASTQAASNTTSGVETMAATTRVREAGAAVALARARLAQTRLVAPADGRIVGRTVEVGDVIQPGRTLLALASDGETRLIAQIDEKNLSQLKEGQKAIATADAFPSQAFGAEISFLAPSVDSARGTFETRLIVPKPPAFLRDDMTVSVEVVAAQKDRAIVVPTAALRESDGGVHVLVANNGIARRVNVKTGVRSAQRVEIVEGLAADASVVVTPAIQDGQKIRPQSIAARKTSDFAPPMPGQ